jgi:hypothetical protein
LETTHGASLARSGRSKSRASHTITVAKSLHFGRVLATKAGFEPKEANAAKSTNVWKREMQSAQTALVLDQRVFPFCKKFVSLQGIKKCHQGGFQRNGRAFSAILSIVKRWQRASSVC